VLGTVPRVYPLGVEDDMGPSAYFALTSDPARTLAGLFVKTTGPAEAMVPVVTDALKSFAPPTKDPFVRLPDEALGRITATRRFTGGLMAAFGLVGVLIGAAGVYAVMASFVAQQTREIGVRVALGATPARIQRGLLGLAWRHLVVGLVIGLPVAWWLSRGFAALLFQVTPADVSVYVGVSALVSVVGFLAAWIPARRAARIDPIVSMRQ
jgi:ABC-type antimicrobial peptide transport system permease subunit